MAKLFTPSVRCPVCGYKRKVLSSDNKSGSLKVDLHSIDKRLQQLLNFDQATSYSKQKDSLQRELEVFLSALPGQVSLATATPTDICRFPIFKDKDG